MRLEVDLIWILLDRAILCLKILIHLSRGHRWIQEDHGDASVAMWREVNVVRTLSFIPNSE